MKSSGTGTTGACSGTGASADAGADSINAGHGNGYEYGSSAATDAAGNAAAAVYDADTECQRTAGADPADLIMDVPLEVTVELGRSNKSIKEILDFSPGTIIELNKLAGEPVDVLVNGKFVAKGEVVVIEENFGIRITEISK